MGAASQKCVLGPKVGHGVSGNVYQTWNDQVIKIYPPIKVVLDKDKSPQIIPFKGSIEADILFRLSSPYLIQGVQMYDQGECGKEHGMAFVLPRLTGTFETLVREGKLNFALATRLLSEIGLALKCLHDHGYIYRDFHLGNCMYTGSPEDPHAVLIDYGNAFAFSRSGRQVLLNNYSCGFSFCDDIISFIDLATEILTDGLSSDTLKDMRNQEKIALIMKLSRFPITSAEAEQIILLLHYRTHKSISIDELIKIIPFLQGAASQPCDSKDVQIIEPLDKSHYQVLLRFLLLSKQWNQNVSVESLFLGVDILLRALLQLTPAHYADAPSAVGSIVADFFVLIDDVTFFQAQLKTHIIELLGGQLRRSWWYDQVNSNEELVFLVEHVLLHPTLFSEYFTLDTKKLLEGVKPRTTKLVTLEDFWKQIEWTPPVLDTKRIIMPAIFLSIDPSRLPNISSLGLRAVKILDLTKQDNWPSLIPPDFRGVVVLQDTEDAEIIKIVTTSAPLATLLLGK